ncbi:DUF3800 domain-containing protein [Candidatus Uhrbacteria bacterium]|nr:DUF3800 domain-containing protein [Candidatus Uhrbacteria bacterium]
MYLYLDESYNLKDRTKPQFISINGFQTVDVKKLWRRWKAYRLPFVGKSRIHAADRLFEPLRTKLLKFIYNQPDIKLLTVMQEISLIPASGEIEYYGKEEQLLFDKVYADMLKALFKASHIQAYKKVYITVDSRKHQHGVLSKVQFHKNILSFLKNWYPNTIVHFEMQPSYSNILLEIADFISNSFYRQYIGQEMKLLEPLKGRTLIMKNPLKRG